MTGGRSQINVEAACTKQLLFSNTDVVLSAATATDL
jgi:hypothetical protein